MKLPLLASVPHAGLGVPDEAAPYCVLTEEEIRDDGDVGAAEIYDLEHAFEAYHTTDVARAIVDLNRAEDDRRRDGVVKTHTCWNVPVYRTPLPQDVVSALLERYYHPYHARLVELARRNVRCGVDLHTMAAEGPPVGPDPGVERPWVCLGNVDGTTCPMEWIESLRAAFEVELGSNVNVNDPFKGGFITRSHAKELPWIQIELSRGPYMSNPEKSRAVLEALTRWSKELFSS